MVDVSGAAKGLVTEVSPDKAIASRGARLALAGAFAFLLVSSCQAAGSGVKVTRDGGAVPRWAPVAAPRPDGSARERGAALPAPVEEPTAGQAARAPGPAVPLSSPGRAEGQEDRGWAWGARRPGARVEEPAVAAQEEPAAGPRVAQAQAEARQRAGRAG